ncbi:class I adenylate-forming enzyme family protein [Patulibacter sp.]|uniref:class I adenylate-forming enzyme family protein n=1 Tax=Patulibacter sp. TaxID=1912859 RepID=UPI002717593F|nr:AMP-binding protein [Patulibacter sp.]MDO9406836.1 AMP-binding protein [Patulibacter sp.]
MSVVESWLLRAARRRPDHEALVGTSYAALLREVDDVAARLWATGVRPGEPAGLQLGPGRPFVLALHALLRIGALVVPLDPRLAPAERDRRLTGVADAAGTGSSPGAAPGRPGPAPGRTVPVLDEAAWSSLPAPSADARLRDEHELDDVAIVVHTSGTSGPAKAVPLTYGNWLWSALGSAATLDCPPGERWLCALPLNHVGGLSVLLRSAIAGTTAVVHEGWDTDRVLASLTGRLPEEGPPPTVVSVVPTTLRRLLDAGLRRTDAMALRWVLLGGASIPAGMLEEARAAGIPVAPTYGMSETTSQIATLGPPLFCTTVEIAGADGSPTTEAGVVGEVLVHGPTVSRAVLAADGRLHTGDLGVLDDRGHLTIVGRSSDTIITGGENVLPLEVERVLEADPTVAEAAVFGRPDREWGERVCARIVPAAGATVDLDALRRAAAAGLLRHQVPREIEVADELPRTASGKLLRRALT